MPRGGVTARVGPGTALGERYRLTRLLGTGGMASVWLGRDQRLGRTVAVKVLSEVLALDDDYVRRFRREARIAAGLSHPGLVRVYDFGTEGERPYLVMDHVDGGTLADRPAASVSAEALATDLLGALAHIHSAGVIHRDVKPANVLIDDEGRARLTDFGIAWPEDATQITQTGEVIGTLRYMAPEAREGDPATERSDLYSCGVVLSERLGRSPRPELAELVARLTEPDPARRPASAREALRRLEADDGTAATEVIEAAPAGRRGGGVAVGVATAVTALAGLVALALLLVLLLGGGDGPGGREARAGAPAQPRTTTVTTTEAAPPVTTTVPAAPAPKPKPRPKPKPEKPPQGFGPGGTGPPGQVGRGSGGVFGED